MSRFKTRSSAPAAFVVAVLVCAVAGAALAANPPYVGKFLAEHFPLWDRNHDGVLDLSEVHAVIEDPSTRGYEAAVIVVVGRHMSSEEDRDHLSRSQVLSLARDRSFVKAVSSTYKRLENVDHDLFLPGDPDLSTFHQGRLGDCYLLSPVAALVHRDPQSIRAMIQPIPKGGYEVAFGDGRRVEVPPLTDAELLLGARMDSRHGTWLAVIEKAYGLIREGGVAKRTGVPADPRTTVPDELIGGGRSSDSIALLTGHRAQVLGYLGVRTPIGQVHETLTTTTQQRRLVCAGTPKLTGSPGGPARVPGISYHHSYAVFGYDSERRQVTLFNPHGNGFEPKGPPGPANGYPTQHGVFTLPLQDFVHIFQHMSCETDQPEKR
jgi:hypothetical protein